MDYVGGCGMYIVMCGLLSLMLLMVLLLSARREAFGTFIELLRALDDSELNYCVIGIDLGEWYVMNKLFEIVVFRMRYLVLS